MKPFIPYSFLAAAAACGMAFGQAYTTPVGYVTQDLLQGFNTVGLTLQNSAIESGDFETVSGTTLTDTDVTYAPEAGRTYVLEITSGTLEGSIQEVAAASVSGSSITTPDDLGALGLAADDTYKLRVAPTLEELFGTTSVAADGVLLAGLNSTNADVVWIPTGSGGYDQYFLHTSGEFRRAGTTTPTPNVPVIYADGILVQKKSGATAAVTVTGELKTVGTNSVISQGFNLVSVVAPVGLTLRTAGLEDDLTAALNTTNADILWVQNPTTLAYDKYFRHTLGGGQWRDVAAPTVELNPSLDPELPSAVFIQRKPTGSVNLSLEVPSSYSSL